MPPLHYFAYGSNMLRARLIARDVLLLDHGQPGSANGYNLLFNKRSDDGSSKANLVAAPGEKTWGVLFAVEPNSLDDLDNAEGAPDHYRREYGLRVQTPAGEVEAMTYLAQPGKIQANPGHPYDWYLALILAGALANPAIPRRWLAHLRQIAQPIADPRQPPRRTCSEAITQLRAAGHENWQDLLNPEPH
jgi:gamma-glutamylcyclotransferase